MNSKNWPQILSGPLVFIAMILAGGPSDMSHEAWMVLSCTAWIAIWWITEAVPLPITSLLPLVLFPMTGAMDLSTTSASFGHKYIFLYVGGFTLAIAIEKWNLHKRIALGIILLVGNNITSIVLGFMMATAFLSMWISNTATAVMMLPIGMAIVTHFNEQGGSANFGKALMLSIAYSASIGGMATLIGTPPNLVLAGIVKETYGVEITFLQWFIYGFPISVILLFCAWRYLIGPAFKLHGVKLPGGHEEIKRLKHQLGPIKPEEKTVLAVFIATAVCWITRSFLLTPYVNQSIDDTIIAVIAAVALFVLPSSNLKKPLITWEDAVKMPWGVLLLFGGGMALATGFTTTGLADWIGSQLTLLGGLSLLLIVLLLIAAVNFLTEVTSNLATTAMLLPVLAPMALAIDVHPFVLMVGATTAASCAYMLPVATPPNAVVFGSGQLRIKDMVKSGFWMNIISILLVTLFVYFLLPVLWNIDPLGFPAELMVK